MVVAPVMIVVTFCQTIAVLLEMKVEWPINLRALMQSLNVFNFSIELMRPECSFRFGFLNRLQFTLYLPVAITFVLGLYCVIKILLARRESLESFKRIHGGKTPQEFVIKQVVMVLSSMFVFLSVFFLRTVRCEFIA